MRRDKKLLINGVIDLYSRKAKRAELTVRKLDRDTVLIEGTSNSLKFLAHILLALTEEEEDCGFQFSPKGAGNAWFAKDAQLGIYLHRLPCIGKLPQGRGIYERPLRGKNS